VLGLGDRQWRGLRGKEIGFILQDALVSLDHALFEVSGTRSSLDELNLNRHWRNARTHTLHDPAVWKVQHVGRYTLNGTLPPRHGLL
jgi:alkylation response protein AidB-like acyl-CoA dehydrogenase